MTAPSVFIEGAAVIAGVDALILSKLWPRARRAEMLDAQGVSDPARESILRSLDAIDQAGRAFERASAARLTVSEFGTSEVPEGLVAASSAAMATTITTGEASRRLGCSDRYVRHLIDAERLPGLREGRVWRVGEAAVDVMAANRAAEAARGG